MPIASCTRCGKCFEAQSEEDASCPVRLCIQCSKMAAWAGSGPPVRGRRAILQASMSTGKVTYRRSCFLHGDFEGDGCPQCLADRHARTPICIWTWDDDVYGGHWDTECGETFHFEYGGKPGERSRVRFCCYCGKSIRINVPVGDELQSDDLLP